jgi:uncharacterized protein (TIGR03435 family)
VRSIIAVAIVAGHAVLAQNAPAELRFEVASVKRSPPFSQRALQPFAGVPQPGVWRLRDLPIVAALRNAYPGHPLSVQIVGAPEWAGTDRGDYYDIEARTTPTATADEIRQMTRALLADRFKLRLHQEQREVPAFVLVKRKDGKLGSGLKSPAIDCAAFRAGGPRPIDPAQRNADRLPCGVTELPVFDHTRVIPGTDWRVTAGDTPVSGILTLLGNRLGRPVIDRSGLTQRFEIELQFLAGPVRTDGDNGPPLRAAIEEQLGLEVEDGRAPVDVLVIDHIERPSEN